MVANLDMVSRSREKSPGPIQILFKDHLSKWTQPICRAKFYTWGWATAYSGVASSYRNALCSRLTPLNSGTPVALMCVNFPTLAVECDSAAIVPRPTSSGELVRDDLQVFHWHDCRASESCATEVNIRFAIAVALFMAQADCGRLGVHALRSCVRIPTDTISF